MRATSRSGSGDGSHEGLRERGAGAQILVRGPNWVGDLVMATPGFRCLRAGFPDARISLHLRPGLESLMTGAPWFDEVIPVSSYHKGFASMLGEASGLRRRDFDLGLCLPDSISSALLMRLSGVREVVGYRRRGRGLLLQRPVEPAADWGKRGLVARERFVLDLVRALGCDERGTELELHTTAHEEAEADHLLATHGLADRGPLVIVAPGASFGSSKLWPAESFARVGDALARTGARVVLSGSPAEATLTARVREEMCEDATDLVAELDLGVLKALVRRASLVVCNDAGTRHLAAAFRIPCVVLMGPTSLEKTNLNLERTRIMATAVDCRPCYLRDCPIDHRCMTRIDPEEVIEVALAELAAFESAKAAE